MAHPSSMGSQAFWVIVIGSFAGGLVRGITGFGSAIILVLFWVTAKILTLQPGPLGLAIVSDCISSVASAVPLFVLTKAHKTSDWRLVTTLVIFKTALSPVGAVMLVILNKRVVELTMALCLVAVIALQSDITGTISGFCKWLTRSSNNPELLQPLKPANDMDGKVSESCDASIHIVVAAGNDTCSTTSTKSLESQSSSSSSDSGLINDTPTKTLCHDITHQGAQTFVQPCDLVASLHIPDKSVLTVGNGIAIAKVPSTPTRFDDCEQQRMTATDNKDTAQLLLADKQQQSMPHSNGSSDDGCNTTGTSISKWSKFRSFFSNKDNQRMLKYGTFAGCMSGLMDGMTGMGGPPIMYMYSKLKIPKDIARGVGASQNLCQFRLIAYIALGVFEKQYLVLYVSAATVHIVGIALGSVVLNKYINQQAFGRILTSLMCACCILLFAAAAGVTSS